MPGENIFEKAIDTNKLISISSHPVTKMFNLDEVLALMKRQQGKRTNKDFAAELGISAQFLGDIYMGRREPGEKALAKLGLTKRSIYQKTA